MRNFKNIGIVFGVLLVVTNAFADEFVSYEIARVVKVDPIGNMKAYSVPRMSCTNTETIQGAGAPVQTLSPTHGARQTRERRGDRDRARIARLHVGHREGGFGDAVTKTTSPMPGRGCGAAPVYRVILDGVKRRQSIVDPRA